MKRYIFSLMLLTSNIVFSQYLSKDFTFEDKLTTVVGIIRIDVEGYTAKHRPTPKR